MFTPDNGSKAGGADGQEALRAKRLITMRLLQHTISPEEYRVVEKFLSSRSPALSSKLPSSEKFESVARGRSEEFASAFRLASRLYGATAVTLYLADTAKNTLQKRRTGVAPPAKSVPYLKNPNHLFSLSVGSVVFLHRILYSYFTEVQRNASSKSATELRRKHPKIARALASKITPSIGASLAGLALAIGPADDRRVTITIYILARAIEFLYNRYDDLGYFKNKPEWLKQWMMFPISSGILLHAFVFDKDCFPTAYGDTILRFSDTYVQQRPANYPAHIGWPDKTQIVDAIAEVARLKFPAFKSPILFPNTSTLPQQLAPIVPIVSPAHPGIQRLSCAILHPQEPSCGRTFLNYCLREFGRLGKIIAIIYLLFSIPRYRSLIRDPANFFAKMARSTLSTTSFLTLAMGSAWASVCFLQRVLPKNFLPTSRFYLSGFIGGLAAYLDVNGSSSYVLYSARLAVETLWKTLVKHKRVKPIKGGDVLLFVAGLAVINSVYEREPQAVSSGLIRNVLNTLRPKECRKEGADSDDKKVKKVEGDEKAKASGSSPLMKDSSTDMGDYSIVDLKEHEGVSGKKQQ